MNDTITYMMLLQKRALAIISTDMTIKEIATTSERPTTNPFWTEGITALKAEDRARGRRTNVVTLPALCQGNV